MTRNEMLGHIEHARQIIRLVKAECDRNDGGTDRDWEERFAANVLKGADNCLNGAQEYLLGNRTEKQAS